MASAVPNRRAIDGPGSIPASHTVCARVRRILSLGPDSQATSVRNRERSPGSSPAFTFSVCGRTGVHGDGTKHREWCQC